MIEPRTKSQITQMILELPVLSDLQPGDTTIHGTDNPTYINMGYGGRITVHSGNQSIVIKDPSNDQSIDQIPLSILVKCHQGLTGFPEQGRALNDIELLQWYRNETTMRPDLNRPIDTHFVLIPTQDRPEDLKRCVTSIFEQHRMYPHHKIKIIIYDDSLLESSKKVNRLHIRILKERENKDCSIHYADAKDVQSILAEKSSLSPYHQSLIFPKTPSFGRARNALFILAAIEHGGRNENTAIHFFDDDTSLHTVQMNGVVAEKDIIVDPYSGDFFEQTASALMKTGHAGACVQGILDMPQLELVSLWRSFLEEKLSLLVHSQEEFSKGIFSAEDLASYIEVLNDGRVPHIDHRILGNNMYEFLSEFSSNIVTLGSGRSLLYEVALALPFPLGGSDEDHIHEHTIALLGYRQENSQGRIHHWYGKQKSPHGLSLCIEERDLETIQHLDRVGERLAAAIRENNRHSEIQYPKRNSLLRYGENHYTRVQLTTWEKLKKELIQSEVNG